MRLEQRLQPQWAPFCDWCGGIQVGAWYASCRTMLRILVAHRRLHRQQARMGLSIRAIDR